MHDQLITEMPDTTSKEKAWEAIMIKIIRPEAETEALICAPETLRTNDVEYNIDKISNSPSCRACGEKGDGVSHCLRM